MSGNWMSSSTSVRLERTRLRQRRGAIGGLADDLEPTRHQQRAGERPEVGVVVDDQDGRAHAVIVARRPGPTSGLTLARAARTALLSSCHRRGEPTAPHNSSLLVHPGSDATGPERLAERSSHCKGAARKARRCPPCRASRKSGSPRALAAGSYGAAPCRPTQQRAGAQPGAPGLLLCREAGARPCAPPHRPDRASHIPSRLACFRDGGRAWPPGCAVLEAAPFGVAW